MAHVITTPTVWLDEQTANTTDNGPGGNDQSAPKIVSLSNGNFVVLWADNSGVISGAGNGMDIIGQIYDPLGVKIGDEFRVNQGWVVDDEENLDVAALPNGGFVVVFEDNDVSGTSIRSIEWNADASSFFIRDIASDPGADLLSLPHVAVQSDGGYMVTYSIEVGGAGGTLQTAAKIVSSGGVVSNEVLLLNVDNTGVGQEGNDVATLSNGNYVIVGIDTDGGGNEGIYLRIVDSSGTNVASATLVSEFGVDNYEPSVAALTGGGFVVVWTNGDGVDIDVIFQRYNADGTTAGNLYNMSGSNGIDNNNETSITSLADGGFMIVWDSDGDGAIQGQRFDASGDAVGSEITIIDSGTEYDTTITLLEDGRFVVGWTITNLGNEDVQFEIYDPRDPTIGGLGGDDVITGRQEDSIVFGYGGNDTIYGFGGDDILYGDAGDDIIYGGVGNDIVYGGDGNDVLEGGAGNDILRTVISNDGDLDLLDGGDGIDSADYSQFSSAVWVDLEYNGIEGWTRDGANLDAGAWREITNLDNIENLTGTDYNDTLAGDAGNNIFSYNGGNDIFDGRAGIDSADYSQFGSAVWVDLEYNGVEGWTRDGADLSSGAWREITELNNVENLTGTAFDDQLYGDAGANELAGNAGNDILNGGSGSDILYGGVGNDKFLAYIFDAADVDQLDGGGGTDVADYSQFSSAVWVDLEYNGIEGWTRDGANLDAGAWREITNLDNIENLTGTDFNDYLSGNASNNTFSYTGGNDIFDGRDGVDSADYSQFGSAVWVDLEYNGVEGWTTDGANLSTGTWREITDLDNIENITGTAFDDELAGDNSDNILLGGSGNDTLAGRDGNDVFFFDDNYGNDIIEDWQDTGSGFEDIIDFSDNSQVNDFADISIAYAAGDAVLTTADGTITLVGVGAGIDAGDFIF